MRRVYSLYMATTETPTQEEHAINQGSTFVWHEIYAPDAQAAIDFYTKALDFGTEDWPAEGFTYRMLTKNGKGVAGVMSTSEGPAEGAPTHWSTFIAVDNVDSRLAKCQELGATVVHGPMDIPKVGRMVLIKDPQGAVVWLFHPEPM